MKAAELLALLKEREPAADEPFARAFQAQELEALCTGAAALCRSARDADVQLILDGGLTSDSFSVFQPVRTERSVDAGRLRAERPDVYAACVYVDASDAKRLLGGSRGMYAVLKERADAERLTAVERVMLRELDALLTPEEEALYVSAVNRPAGLPAVVRLEVQA